MIATVVFGVAALTPLTAVAYTPTTLLGQVGQTELQQRNGDAVQTVCGQLGALGGARTALQTDLFDRCGNMVGNASVLLGGGHPAEPKSLGWTTQSEVGALVQTVVHEELAATKSLATELNGNQTRFAFARLQALRSGVRLTGSVDGQHVFETLAYGGYPDESGGAAGDALGGAWSFFANANYATGDRDRTDREDGFDYDAYGLTVGGDYRLSDAAVVGGLLSYQRGETDFDTNSSFSSSPSGSPGGGIDTDSVGIGIFGTYYQDNYYFDGMIGYARTDLDLDRKIVLPLGPGPGAGAAAIASVRTAKGTTDADTFNISAGGGMDFNAGSLTYGPYLRADYINMKVDGYRESGAQGLNLTVKGQTWESLTATLGGQISYASSQKWGVLVPYARFGWVHEFMNDSERATAFYTVDPNQNKLVAITDDPDRDYFELSMGVSSVLSKGVQGFLSYETLIDHEYLTDHSFTAGIRIDM